VSAHPALASLPGTIHLGKDAHGAGSDGLPDLSAPDSRLLMFDPADLFVRAIDKLSAKLVNRSPDSVFDSVVVVRQLLMDNSPFLYQANRSFRLKLQVNPMLFEGMPTFLREEGSLFMHIDAFSPSAAPHLNSETVDLGQLRSPSS
jgi:hypothetical protein